MASAELLGAVKNAISESMDDIVNHTTNAMKRAMSDDIDKVVEKRVKYEEKPTFKKKLNEDQFKHSKEMERIMDRITSSLENKEYEKAQEAVDEGKKLLQKRQKYIKIADREEDGWEVIKCYKSDVLASDSDDEKRLNKSRRQARMNKKEAKTRRNRRRSSNYSTRNRDSNDYSSNSRYNKSVCYFCGETGHIQYRCPAKRGDSHKGH